MEEEYRKRYQEVIAPKLHDNFQARSPYILAPYEYEGLRKRGLSGDFLISHVAKL